MQIRFSTVAANADRLREDSAPSQREAPRAVPERKSSSGPEDVKPGKDINAPGFIKEKEPSES
jgi:hypothetical protein